MILKIPIINKGEKSHVFITSDNKRFSNADEAEWHEFTVCQLKQRRIKFEIPEHNIYSFTNHDEIKKYVKECYGHMNYIVKPLIESLIVPNDYVIIENELVEGDKILHEITFKSLEDFKRELVAEILR